MLFFSKDSKLYPSAFRDTDFAFGKQFLTRRLKTTRNSVRRENNDPVSGWTVEDWATRPIAKKGSYLLIN